ncbi:MAG: hypothetical protein CFE43_12925 [Burkholderiales bacterium PBB3]|nr:MAG: hypothetical protein CFE43_12925 [Burkholderiales bacterium PBB3]
MQFLRNSGPSSWPRRKRYEEGSFAQQQVHCPWDDAYWMRNVLSHGYLQVDLDMVWNTATAELPAFLALIGAMA